MSTAGVGMDALAILKSQLFQIAKANGLAIEECGTLTPRDLHHASCKRTTLHAPENVGPVLYGQSAFWGFVTRLIVASIVQTHSIAKP